MEDHISVRTPAKINLLLDVVGRRHDGYHFIKSIMQAVSIYDTITISKNNTDDIIIECSDLQIPCDQSNLAYKAAISFFNQTKVKRIGLDISINKEIPQLAGLAGGSANAAGTIVALNEFFHVGLSVDELCDIGSEVGADVPFCIMGGTTLVEGIGDILTPLPDLPDCYIVVVKPDANISTAQAFAKIDSVSVPKSSELDGFVAGLVVSDLEKISELLFNSFEYACDIPEVKVLKDEIMSFGAINAVMTGSGSAVFGIFSKKKYAQKCEEILSQKYSFAKMCTPHHGGAEVFVDK